MEITINGKKSILTNILTDKQIEDAIDKMKLGELLDGKGLAEKLKLTESKINRMNKTDGINSYIVNGKRLFGSKKTITALKKELGM